MPNAPIAWNEEDLSPIRDRVYEYIKQAIIQGVYQSGERIKERELAELLNVSRTPIREALFRLESQGFVTTIPRKGVIVSKLSQEEIIEIFLILSSVESLAMKLAAERANPSHRDELGAIIGEIDAMLKQNQVTKESSVFHFKINDVICRAAQSPRLVQMLDGLSDYIRSFVQLGYGIPGRITKAMEEHRDLAQAVRDGNGDRAEELTKVHLENAKRAYLDALEKS